MTIVRTLELPLSGEVARPRSVLARLGKAFAQWRRGERERREAILLDERMRRDIGLGKADAWIGAEKHFWRL